MCRRSRLNNIGQALFAILNGQVDNMSILTYT